MTVTRLRPAHTPERLAEIYARPHAHTAFTDHVLRVQDTVSAVAGRHFAVAADLSCGDGAILRGITADRKIFGDIARGYEVCGPLEVTVPELPPVDLFVCCETLEHLDSPEYALTLMRERASVLLLSTPVDAWEDSNDEHYWAWNRRGVEGMLKRAGWSVDTYRTSDLRSSGFTYCFGIWTCT